ncbi:MAG: butyrate kinase [Synergistetes bacterium]|nr:butyrate kinase [Synergistota bacterium]
MSDFMVLVINPGSSSTKTSLFRGEEELWSKKLFHTNEELSEFAHIVDQQDYRYNMIVSSLKKTGFEIDQLDAVVGRGGLLDPLESGTYVVDDVLIRDLKRGKPWEHASNLGGIIARKIADSVGIPAFVVDPVSVDEFEEVSRITGMPEIEKRSLSHALNIKAVVRRAAARMGKPYDELNFIIAHLGGGISVAAHKRGRMIDVNNANELGPFSPERTGGLPAVDIIKMAYSGKYTYKELRSKLVGKGGLVAYLGTNDVRKVKEMIAQGNMNAALVYEAMAYQVAKEIGAMAAALEGNVDAILITGGVAYNGDFVDMIRKRVEFIAPVEVFPGEDEMRALAEGALRVLKGEEEPKLYKR